MNCEKCQAELLSTWLFCPACSAATGNTVGIGKAFSDIINKLVGAGARLPASVGGGYGEGVRRQVFEVIVRQAMVGAPWREICAGPMQVNSITAEEIEEELRRRRGDQPPDAAVPKKPHAPQGEGSVSLSLPPLPTSISDELIVHRDLLLHAVEKEPEEMRSQIKAAAEELAKLIGSVRSLEIEMRRNKNESALQGDLTRELNRTTQPHKLGEDFGPHPAK